MGDSHFVQAVITDFNQLTRAAALWHILGLFGCGDTKFSLVIVEE